MKRYSKKSTVKKIKVLESTENNIFCAEIISEPLKSLESKQSRALMVETSKLVEKAWGVFPDTYLEQSILGSYYLLLLRDSADNLVGIAPVRKVKIQRRWVYVFGLTAVHPDYQGLGLMKKMYAHVLTKVFLENMMKGKLAVEFIFITSNALTIGSIAKLARFVYPNPYLINMETGRVDDPDEGTWETVKLFLEEEGEKYRDLQKNGSVMIGFYDDKKDLLMQWGVEQKNKSMQLFVKNYLQPGSGKEVVVRAVISVWELLSAAIN